MSQLEANSKVANPSSFIQSCHPSIMEGNVQLNISPTDSTQTNSYPHSLLHPLSIFQASSHAPTLDDYIKIKMLDKPRSTLQIIQQKQKLFLDYTSQQGSKQVSNSFPSQQLINQHSSRSRQQFTQHTFTKIILPKTLIIVTVSPSKSFKCNIIVQNIRGEVLKYFPNTLNVKIGCKLYKLLKQNTQGSFYIIDHTNINSTLSTLPKLITAVKSFYYVLSDMKNILQEQLLILRQKLAHETPSLFRNNSKKLQLMSQQFMEFEGKGLLKNIHKAVQKMHQQQNIFLTKFRGKVLQQNRIITFDMMAVNMWLRYGWNCDVLCNKIIQLFDLKKKSVQEMIQESSNLLHFLVKKKNAQSCILCLSNNPQVKKPKRTYWACDACSFQREKPIFLCRRHCFESFHDNPDIKTFKRNERRSKKIKRRPICLINKMDDKESSHSDKKVAKQQHQALINKKIKLMETLDKTTDEYFSKIDELIKDNRLASAQFYLSMLMNQTIQQLNLPASNQNIIKSNHEPKQF